MTPIRAAVVVVLLAAATARGQVVSAPVVPPPGVSTVLSGQGVALVPSVVALTLSSALTLFYGEPVDGLAQVTAGDGSAVTGAVTFYDGATAFCTLSLADGAACPESTSTVFAAGKHIFTATYSGDATHAGATSNAVTVVVQQDATATSLASSANPVAAGGNVVYSAAVQGQHGLAVGAVNFMDGDAVIGQASLNRAGQASLAVLMMAPGTHHITAVYVGNGNSAGSTSQVVDEVVNAPLPASTTSLSAGADSATAGQSVTFAAQVSVAGHIATGTVTFVEGGVELGTATLNANGIAVWSSSSLGVGAHSIMARYAGDGATAPSISSVVTVTIKQSSPGNTFSVVTGTVTVSAGSTAVVPVVMTAGASAMTASCTGLPDEATCSYVAGTVRIQTVGPRDCGEVKPYGVAELPLAGRVFAAFIVVLIPRRRWKRKGLLAAICAVFLLGSISGCGTGNCTDLGSRPGTYNVSISLSGMAGTQKVTLIVKP